MQLSQKELRSLIAKNPTVSVQENGKTILLSSLLREQKQAKYRNVKVYVYPNGYVSQGTKLPEYGKPEAVYDSIKEYERWCELQLLQKAGVITDLERQTAVIVQPEVIRKDGQKIKAIVYKADFRYGRDGKTVVEDVKPFDKKSQKYKTTKDFNLKWKMMQAKYPDISFEIF